MRYCAIYDRMLTGSYGHIPLNCTCKAPLPKQSLTKETRLHDRPNVHRNRGVPTPQYLQDTASERRCRL